MSGIATRRSLIYWVIFLTFLLGGGPIYSLQGSISPFIHTLLDSMAVVGVIVATIVSFRVYRKTGATMLAIIAVGLAGTAALELLHTMADTALLSPWITSELQFFMPWSWHASRVLLAVVMLAAALHGTRENFGEPETKAQKSFPTPRLFAVLLTVAVTVTIIALMNVELPSIYYASLGLFRLPEVFSGLTFVAAIFLLTRKGNWRTDSYGHWLYLGIVASICGQLFTMAFSKELFDASFTAAHMLKVATYACIIYGFSRAHHVSARATEAELSKPKGLGLGAKLAILCGFIAFCATMPLAIKSSRTLHDIAATNAIETLSGNAASTGAALKEQRARVTSDLSYLASEANLQGLYQAAAEDADSPVGSSRQQTLADLKRLVRNLMLSDSEYLSIAYVDTLTGEVLVRSDQFNSSILTASGELYLAENIQQLALQTAGPGQVRSLVRSDIKLLEGKNASAGSQLQLEGTALPVFSAEQGTPLGAFVLHSDISDELAAVDISDVETQLFVVNSEGRFVSHPDPAKEAVAGLDSVYTVADEFPGLDFAALTAEGASGGAIYERPDGKEIIVGAVRMTDVMGAGEPLLYIYSGSRADLELQATEIGYELQQIAQAVLLAMVLFGWFFARRFAKPVQQISSAAVEFGRSGTVTDIPYQGSDEIGMLAKSLSEMMNEVSSQRDKLLLLSSAVESSLDSTIITTIRGTIEYVNPQYERYSGVAASELLGKNIMELREFKENRHILSKAPAKKGDELVWIGELRTRRADRKIHDEIITISPIRNADGENINQSLIIEDITDRKAMERNIERKSDELQRSNRDLEQFAYVASHDLKAPLRAIEVIVGWLKDDLEEHKGDDVHENLGLLEQRTARLSRLLDDLLAYSRAGRKNGGVKTIDTKELVDDIATLIAPPEGFVIEADGSLPKIVTHHAPLETVFRNLMSNAIKHSPVPEEGRIRVYAEDKGDMVEFAVEDNGTGIPQEYAEKVFKMFQTLQARDEKEGSGMGLAIVQRIIDWQGGKIWFHDGPDNKGSVFRFTWNKTPTDMPEMDEEQVDEGTGVFQVTDDGGIEAIADDEPDQAEEKPAMGDTQSLVPEEGS